MSKLEGVFSVTFRDFPTPMMKKTSPTTKNYDTHYAKGAVVEKFCSTG